MDISAGTDATQSKDTTTMPDDSGPAPSGLPTIIEETKRWSRGLVNTRGYCYRNAVLQVLFNQPELRELIENGHTDCGLGQYECVLCALQHLMNTYWSNSDDSLLRWDALRFHDTLEATVPADHPLHRCFQGDKGGYSNRFLGYILDQFQQEEEQKGRSMMKTLLNFRQEVVWTCNDCQRQFRHTENWDETAHYPNNLYIIEPWRTAESLEAYFSDDSYQEEATLTGDGSAFWTKPSMARSRLELKKHGRPGSRKHGRYTCRKYIIEAPQVLLIYWLAWDYKKDSADRHAETIDLRESTKDGVHLLYKLQSVTAYLDVPAHEIAAVRQPDGKQFKTLNDLVVTQSWPGDGNVMELLSPRVEMGSHGHPGVEDFHIDLLCYRKVSE
ncbi:uncharacterized protein LTR77_002643 [Saxophila tyrrhenica]|uniref:USP domain-containing protein n=1 Tax=Saxophila tyrrhenica TaxID=1690608 RepID=A0AAV9PJK0_9PEZI|nr:hypothetical protein LTR77_002643 [Saxophila tyrrhenica]